MIIKNALIHDAVNPIPYKADLRIRKGKIAEIGENLSGEEEILDAEGLNAYPGFVEAHSHLGVDNYGGPTGGTSDGNETNDIISPQLRGIDSYNPMDRAIPMAVEGGVTTVGTGPGSANVFGGTFLAVKLYGNSVDKAAIRPAVAMKTALGENPKRCYSSRGNSTRMSTASKMRETLFLARDYMLRKEAAAGDISKQPKFDMKMESLIPVLKKEIPLKTHAHRADDLLTALRIAREFDVNITLEHVTEGHLIVDELVEANVPLAIGPSMVNASKLEVLNRSWTTPGILAKAGCQVSIITDAPVIPQQYLRICAGMAVNAGMDPFQALQAITINAARHLGIQDRVGSLEAGKDADLVLCEGDPLFSNSRIVKVFIDGEERFSI